MGFCKPMSEEVPLINTKTISKEELDAQRENAAKVQAVLQSRYTDKPLACVITYGCQQNVADSEHIKGMLADMGYAFTDDRHKAQFILFNTCAVREHAEDRVFGNVGALKSYKAEHPDTVIALCGCMMQQQHIAERIKQSFPFVDLVFGTHVVHTLPQLIFEALGSKKQLTVTPTADGVIAEGIPVRRDGSFKAFVPIMYGCNNFCTYCVVPYVRGRERSRDPEIILEEIRELVRDGYKDITLLGQNVNSYGKNLEHPITFAQLLKEIEKIEGLKRIRFMTSHPKDLSDELIEVMAESKKICPHLHLPLQSGSSRVLKEMNRRYTKESYLALVDRIREKLPDISLTTDIIVGFPGETEEDFLETMDVVGKVGYDSAFTFIYSKRSGTPAAAKEDQVPEEVVKDRFDRLLAQVQEIARERSSRFEGTVQEVLVESVNDQDASLVTGRMGNNLLVHFPGDASMIGTFKQIHLDVCKGFYYMGTPAE